MPAVNDPYPDLIPHDVLGTTADIEEIVKRQREAFEQVGSPNTESEILRIFEARKKLQEKIRDSPRNGKLVRANPPMYSQDYHMLSAYYYWNQKVAIVLEYNFVNESGLVDP